VPCRVSVVGRNTRAEGRRAAGVAGVDALRPRTRRVGGRLNVDLATLNPANRAPSPRPLSASILERRAHS